MSDHTTRRDTGIDATLAAIDAATTPLCMTCGRPVPPDGPCDLFCSRPCNPTAVETDEWDGGTTAAQTAKRDQYRAWFQQQDQPHDDAGITWQSYEAEQEWLHTNHLCTPVPATEPSSEPVSFRRVWLNGHEITDTVQSVTFTPEPDVVPGDPDAVEHTISWQADEPEPLDFRLEFALGLEYRVMSRSERAWAHCTCGFRAGTEDHPLPRSIVDPAHWEHVQAVRRVWDLGRRPWTGIASPATNGQRGRP